MVKIVNNTNKKLLVKRAAQALNTLLEQSRKAPVLFLASGGSALGVLDLANAQFLNTHSTLSVLDERFGENLKINNFAQIGTTRFWHDAMRSGATSIDTTAQKDTLEESATRFDSALKKWKKDNPNGTVIVTQGIGIDGHTAGIMPFSQEQELFEELFETENRFVVGYDAGEKNIYPLRITTTLHFLRNVVDHSVVYAIGSEKRDAITRTLATSGTLEETPARVIHEMKDVFLFTNVVI